MSRPRSQLDSRTSVIRVRLINFSVKLYFTVKGSMVSLTWGRHHKVVFNFMIVFNTAHHCTASQQHFQNDCDKLSGRNSTD
jgi:hypothetical protein